MARWGVIGTGDISDRLVSDLAHVEGAQVTAVWGRALDRATAFAEAHGIGAATDSLAALLGRPDIDVVYVATPSHTHRDIALQALAAGKHVLVEKPMASTAAETAEIFDAAERAGLFAMEAMWMRFNPLHVEVLQRIADGEIGAVGSVRASFGTPFFPRGRVKRPEDAGSALRDRGIYAVALTHWTLGEPDAIAARATVTSGVDTSGHATLECEQGFAQIAWSGTEFLDLSAAIAGERGWITLQPMFWAGSTAEVHAGSAERIFASPEIVTHARVGNGYGPMLEAVEESLASGETEHPWHGRQQTVAIATTLDRIVAAANGEDR